jgi:hypothetical protein
VDHQPNEKFRVVQMTPPGSSCSVTIGTGLVDSEPGSLKGLQLVVSDIEAARAELLARGVEVSEIRHFDGNEWVEGRGEDWNSFIDFSDPDGNAWTVQEAPADRKGGEPPSGSGGSGIEKPGPSAGFRAQFFGCGGRIRTSDLRVMSPTSCRCSTPLWDSNRGA